VMLLTGLVDNRKLIETLFDQVNVIDLNLDRIKAYRERVVD